MRRVIHISLNGNAFALEDAAADALSAYLATARAALAGNADLEDILNDLEQAIAEKSGRYLGAHKTVLTAAEVNAILTEMGPVDSGDPGAGTPGVPPASPTRRRRLYRIREGQKIAGVCNGLAAYFGADVSWVRLGFLVLAFFGGLPVLVYVGLLIVLPVARTPEECAAATGEPFNAQELVDRVRNQANGLRQRDWAADKAALREEWEQSTSAVRREWQASTSTVRNDWRAWREKRAAARRARAARAATPPPPAPERSRSRGVADLVTTLLMVPLVLIFGGLAVAWIVMTVMLATTGAVFGAIFPGVIPVWAAILLLWLAFAVVTWPFRLLQHALFPTSQGGLNGVFSMFEFLVALAICMVLASWCYHHLPAVGEAIDHVVTALDGLAQRLTERDGGTRT